MGTVPVGPGLLGNLPGDFPWRGLFLNPSCAEVPEEGLGTSRGGSGSLRVQGLLLWLLLVARALARPGLSLPPAPRTWGDVSHTVGSAETSVAAGTPAVHLMCLGCRWGDGSTEIASGPFLGKGCHTLQPSPAVCPEGTCPGLPQCDSGLRVSSWCLVAEGDRTAELMDEGLEMPGCQGVAPAGEALGGQHSAAPGRRPSPRDSKIVPSSGECQARSLQVVSVLPSTDQAGLMKGGWGLDCDAVRHLVAEVFLLPHSPSVCQ